MGYYTNYDLSDNSQEVIEKIEKISDYKVDSDGFIYGVKWYDHDEHMKQVSLMFPDQILCLNGSGEDSGDVWKARYRNGIGEVVTPKIVFGEFKRII